MNVVQKPPAVSGSIRIERLREIAPNYRAFVIDVWGVICDGTQQFPVAVEALRELRSTAPVLLLSNTARRSEALGGFLGDLGIDESCYDAIITAGELCHVALRQRSWLSTPGSATDIWYLGPERDRRILIDTGLTGQACPEKASALLCTGLDPELPDVASHEKLLLSGIEHGLPFLCANPDREVFIGSNKVPCAGALADLYENLGGSVVHFGKPEIATYDSCLDDLERFAAKIEPAQVLAIGDGMATDILGAHRSGIPSLLIEGTLTAEMRLNPTGPYDRVFPDFITNTLTW